MMDEILKDKLEVGLAVDPHEKEAIYRFRYQIYINEMGKKLQADHEKQLIFDELDKSGYLFYVKVDSELVATMRLNIGIAEEYPLSIQEIFSLHKFQLFQPKQSFLHD